MRLFFFLVIVFAVGFILGGLKESVIEQSKPLGIREVRAKGYKYISPLLRVDIPQTENDEKISALKSKIEQYITDSYDQKKASSVSVYFRHPAHNRRFSINDEEKYTPASVMKIVTLMAYLKKAGNDPPVLTQQLTFDELTNSGGYNFPPQKDIEPGKNYTVNELLSYMMAYSSNDAKDLLSKNLEPIYINKILEDLQLEALDFRETEDFMNVYTYSSFFRTLYNASYLSEAMSEKALELLAGSVFSKGIVAGLPDNIVVAHKFGERNDLGTGIKQLHDCGVVYYPDNPYILCVMTRGTSFDDLAQIIQVISALTYRQVSTRGIN